MSGNCVAIKNNVRQILPIGMGNITEKQRCIAQSRALAPSERFFCVK